VVNGLDTSKELALARVRLLMVTPEAPKPMEPVIALALAEGPARTTAQNAAALIMIGTVLMVRVI
jgi:hypothetical protein